MHYRARELATLNAPHVIGKRLFRSAGVGGQKRVRLSLRSPFVSTPSYSFYAVPPPLSVSP